MGKLSEGLSNMGDKALETIGFKKPEIPKAPEIPESAKPPRHVQLTLAASESLNVDSEGRSLSLVVRIYKLRASTAFLNATLDTFGNNTERTVLGEELIDARELVLLPNQRLQLKEFWARDATHIGVVGLFRSPAAQRWRYAFSVTDWPLDNNILLGAHACALSAASGKLVSQPSDTQPLTTTSCSAH